MNLLDKYLYQVRRYLPFLERDKLIHSLKETILNEIDVTDDNLLLSYLSQLGHPRETARKIRGNRGLFASELEPLFELALKFVSILLPLLLLFMRLLEFVSTNENYDILNLLLYVIYYIPTVVIFLLAAVGFIFLSFLVIDKYIHPRFNLDTLKFNPNRLPLVPSREYQTPFIFNIVGLMISVAILYLINLEQGLIALYHDGTTIPLLNSNFNQILILIDISLIINVGVFIFHIFKRRKTLISKLIGIISNYYFVIILILFAFRKVFNLEFIDTFNIDFLPILVQIVFSIAAIILIIFTSIELFKLYKEKPKSL